MLTNNENQNSVKEEYGYENGSVEEDCDDRSTPMKKEISSSTHRGEQVQRFSHP